MTSNDIERLQIIAITNNKEYLITVTRNRPIINLVTSLCEFQRCDKTLIEEAPITDLTIKEDEQ